MLFVLDTPCYHFQYICFCRWFTVIWILFYISFINLCFRVCSEIPCSSISFILQFILPVALLWGNWNVPQNIVDKSTKLSNIDLSMECFTASSFQFCSSIVKMFFLDCQFSTCHSIPSILGISWKCPNFLKSNILIRSATHGAACMFIFWWVSTMAHGIFESNSGFRVK